MKNTLVLVAVMGAIGIVIAGLHYHIPIVIGLTIVGLALFAAGWGVHMIVTREARIPMSDDADTTYEVHTGLAALVYGLLTVMVSVPFLAFGAGYLV